MHSNKESNILYPAGTINDLPLPPVWSHASLHVCAVLSGCMLLADQLQILTLISLTIPKKGLFHLWNSPGSGLNILVIVVCF